MRALAWQPAVNQHGFGHDIAGLNGGQKHIGRGHLTRVLDQIIEWRGKPACIRLDNGPELISAQMLHWAKQRKITLLHIQPGKPQQNAYVERYNRTVRYDCIERQLACPVPTTTLAGLSDKVRHMKWKEIQCVETKNNKATG